MHPLINPYPNRCTATTLPPAQATSGGKHFQFQRIEPMLTYAHSTSGRGLTAPAIDISLPEARLVYETNLFGTMAMVSAFVPAAVANQRSDPQSFVNLRSRPLCFRLRLLQ